MSQRHNDPPPLRDQLCYAIYTAGIAIQRAYKPLLDELGLTYPQYLVLNVLWAQDDQTVVSIADQLALDSSTLTPLLKRLEAAGLVRRTRNLSNERQVLVALTDQGRTLQHKAGCLSDTLLAASTQTPPQLAALNQDVRYLRDAIYSQIGGWKPPA
ncbi:MULTISPECIES: MarR family winged helix-turn-helix transcriptional regulator [Agrobacterium tumefaciens complex]|jgi:DNA-binding MarR family transcriptional regulator|uniref:MarR family winged helix-turn-helix transcriptional regulator n=1 Tax=Agrobacterium tumefaciens complex TaxID=1183400 RepID=UPI0007615846|nr:MULTISPECIES: MarR family transcriptional regulator [Agrobacterium tumefaciens complex]MCP2138072.1 DNA-binding MarR family transcriptional regulator [Rhizobium sp. SLBN-94]KAB0459091.1 MarR family transcriptional regulator [Agrobacterium tumefaciens]KWT79333.1 MarR family transcriptional regulator [Agrobacterium radiobacter]MBB4409164.1 DNA-binding MarR family transcriptional regulator [Agrobacterium radiobacter]MBB4454045.1 DNA-binding MarR family transcriptional regulator [Agrobacterium 